MVTFNGSCWRTAVDVVLCPEVFADHGVQRPRLTLLQEVRLSALERPRASAEADALGYPLFASLCFAARVAGSLLASRFSSLSIYGLILP